MSDDEVRQAGLYALTQAVAFINNARACIAELHDRLTESQREATVAGDANDGWALEVDKLHKMLDESTNYIADEEIMPTVVQFENGRTVRLVEENGKHYLDVSFVPSFETPLTTDETAAADSITPDFIDGLLAEK